MSDPKPDATMCVNVHHCRSYNKCLSDYQKAKIDRSKYIRLCRRK